LAIYNHWLYLIHGSHCIGFPVKGVVMKGKAREMESLTGQRTIELRDTNNWLKNKKRGRAVEESEQSEARFRVMFETSAVGIGIMGLDRKVIEANPALCQMYKYTCEELVGQTSALVTYPDDMPRANQYLQDLLAGKFNHFTDERRYIHKNGEVLWVQITMSMVKGSHGNPLYIVGMLTDITKKKRTLNDLRSMLFSFFQMAFSKPNFHKSPTFSTP
jgi:PAS domain S-box-containing protein